MLTSREVMQQTGISRATLNNYIALGILPRPIVDAAEPGSGNVRRIGYFEDHVVERIRDVQRLKREGLSMSEIARRFATPHLERGQNGAAPPDVRPANGTGPAAGERRTLAFVPRAVPRPSEPPSVIAPGRPLRLTLDDISHPAYMVSNNFELEWWNNEAASEIFHRRQGLEAESEARNVFRLLFEAQGGQDAGLDWMEALQLHVGVAKNRLAAASLARLTPQLGAARVGLLSTLFDETEAIAKRHIVRTPVRLRNQLGQDVAYELFASFFREGVLFTYLPLGAEADSLLDLLAQREQVIRDLLRRQMPVLTHLAVLVADLDNSQALATELPPEDYFALVNDVWGAMEPIFRSYYGTHGKHLGDGLVYFFLPQPDCNYVLNAIHCAAELREEMRRISREWQVRRNLAAELRLNIGLNEGYEWFGSFHSQTNLDFTVLGGTVAEARGLAGLARGGAIQATRRMITTLTPDERGRLHYGVRRRDAAGNDILIPATYAAIADLVDLETPAHARLAEFGGLAVAEISDILGDKAEKSM